jgi:hypothetical protein
MKNLFLAIIFISFGLTGASQSFIGKSPLRSPSNYEKPKLSTQIGKFKPGRNTWAVWADREGVTSSNGKQLNFAQRFLVVEESPDRTRIHIVEENGTYNSSTDEFISEPIDYGWVPVSSMLLWPTALYSDKTNFRIKVMTITTPKQMFVEIDRINTTKGKKLSFFSNPTTTVENNNELPLFEIFFVYKKEGTRYLLGRRDNISKGNASNYLMGWVDESKIQLWDKRQVIEPDWDKVASEERRLNKSPAALFQTSGEALAYGTTGDTTGNWWSDDRYENKYDPSWKRLPVFNFNPKDNVIETAVVSDLVNESGKSVDEEEIRKLQVLQSDLREKRRNINVVFVIDGTESMAPYFKSVQTAVKNSARTLYNEDNRFLFGAIVYRDYTDPAVDKDPDDKCYSTIPLSSNIERFCAELDPLATIEPACKDLTISEGLYLGLYKARTLFRGKEKESNVIILIGDAADRKGKNRKTVDDVIPNLVKSRINLTSIQVNHGKDQSYEDFLFEVRDMILSSSKQLVDDQEKTFGNQKVLYATARPSLKQETKEDIGFYTLQNSPVTGGLQYVSVGKNLTETRTSQIIEKMIRDMNNRTDTLLKTVDNIVNSITVIDPTKVGSFSPAVKLYLKDAGYSSEQIAILTQKNYQFLLKTYTSLNVQKLKNQIYAFDIFLDEEELNDLVISLQNIYTPGLSGYQRRQTFKDAWFEVLRANYGVSREEINKKSFSEIMSLISGLPSPNPILKKYTFNDILDITRLPDSVFDQILGSIKNKCDQLDKIRADKKYYFMSNDRAFYWIPQSFLP